MMAYGNKNTNHKNGRQLEKIEVTHLMTKVLVGLLCEGEGVSASQTGNISLAS
jgi:hypothetical protein